MARKLGKLLLMTGWILPFWVGGSTLLEYLRAEIAPRLAGDHPMNSFTYVDFSWRCFTVGCVWLAIAVGYRSGKTNP